MTKVNISNIVNLLISIMSLAFPLSMAIAFNEIMYFLMTMLFLPFSWYALKMALAKDLAQYEEAYTGFHSSSRAGLTVLIVATILLSL